MFSQLWINEREENRFLERYRDDLQVVRELEEEGVAVF